jgi:hypothetical protein
MDYLYLQLSDLEMEKPELKKENQEDKKSIIIIDMDSSDKETSEEIDMS